jgi:hypothetical protein
VLSALAQWHAPRGAICRVPGRASQVEKKWLLNRVPSAKVLRESHMRKLFETIATLALTTHFARAADWPLCASCVVKAQAPNVVLAGGMVTTMVPVGGTGMGGGAPPGGGGAPPGGGGVPSMGGGMPSIGGGSFLGGMRPMGGDTVPLGAGTRAEGVDTDPPRAKIRNNPRNRKSSTGQ